LFDYKTTLSVVWLYSFHLPRCAVRMQMRAEIENEFIQRNSKDFLLNFAG